MYGDAFLEVEFWLSNFLSAKVTNTTSKNIKCRLCNGMSLCNRSATSETLGLLELLILTAKIGAIWETSGHLTVAHHYINDSLLNEEHFVANSAFFYNYISRLEDFIFKSSNYRIDKIGVRVGKEGHRSDQCSAVVVNHILRDNVV